MNTPEEDKLLKVIRDLKVEYGRILLTVYFQNGKLIRVEAEKVIESKAIGG